MTPGQLVRVARTAAHVPPAQAAHWARLRAQRGVLGACPPAAARRLVMGWGRRPAAAGGWPVGFSPLDAQLTGTWPPAAELRAGKVTLLGMSRSLTGPAGWEHPDAPRLWRFHLHYWDWAWGLAADAERDGARELFARLWTSWSAGTGFARGDAWHPYPTALRAWAWCGLYGPLVAGSDLAPAVAAALASHAAFLRRHLETDVAGNHLIKGLKALVGLGVFAGDNRAVHHALRRLARQARAQVLPDGGHSERAPAYHCQVLADLIDVTALVEAAGVVPPVELTSAVARMRRWLGVVLGPDGDVPLLGDGYPVPRELVALLRPVPPAHAPLVVLPNSGLARLAAAGWHVLADAGGAPPWGVAAHAHAGTLGCVVYTGGRPLLVDTGTSTYEPGPARAYERSTAAHNTVEVDGTDSTEVWGGFRVGRRARTSWLASHASGGTPVCAAAHDGYRHLPGRPSHRRRWSLRGADLVVDDLITGHGRHTVTLRWHLAPGVTVHPGSGSAEVVTGTGAFRVRVHASAPLRLATCTRPVAAGFGLTTDSAVLECRADGLLPLRVRTVWARGAVVGAEEASTCDR
jgi:uncharacterized heparinase superfamily protein